MSDKDKYIEGKFSECLDRLLAGEEVPATEETSEEFRTALDFAREMLTRRESPSAVFKADLKKRLIYKLVEEELRARQEVKKGRFWSSMVWRTAVTAAVVIVLSVVGFFIYMNQFPGEPSAPTAPSPATPATPAPAPSTPAPATPSVPATPTAPSTPAPAPSVPTTGAVLQISATPGQTVYSRGEPVTTEFVFKNIGAEPLEIGSFPPEIVLSPSPRDGIAIRNFPQGNQSMYFDPGEVASFTVTWDQRDNSGDQVPPGAYYFTAETLITTMEGAEPVYVQIPASPILEVVIR